MKPVPALGPSLVATALMLVSCAGPAEPAPVPAAPAPSAAVPESPAPSAQVPESARAAGSPGALAGAGTADIRVQRVELGHLRAVRLARQAGFDRLVMEFTDRVPGYLVGYRPLPAVADGSGAPIPLPGAATSVTVTLSPASSHHEADGSPVYTGPATVTGDTAQVTQAASAGDFEAIVTWVIGMRSRTPYRVTELAGPPRLVVDFQQ